MIKEFKAFIMKGNVLELAVAVIMATYFGAIIKSLVDDLLMPVIGKVIGGVDFSQMKMVITEAVAATETTEAIPAVTINYGMFINHIITFVIVAFVIFLIVKGYNKTQKQEEEAPAAPPAPSKEEVLLGEIRDLLKK